MSQKMTPKQFVRAVQKLTPKQRHDIMVEVAKTGYSALGLVPGLGEFLSMVDAIRGGRATALAIMRAVDEGRMQEAYLQAERLGGLMLYATPEDRRRWQWLGMNDLDED